MPRIWKTLVTSGALVVALLVWGCEQATDPAVQPQQVEVEAADKLLGGVVGGLTGKLGLGDLAGLDPVIATVDAVVDGLVTAIVGSDGGVLELGDHVLTVPAGAVSEDTRFTMRMVSGGGIQVELHATKETTNDVGESGFDRPVRIALSYANTDAGDPEDLVIVRVDGEEPLDTRVSTDGTSTVWAEVDHFSRYLLCTN